MSNHKIEPPSKPAYGLLPRLPLEAIARVLQWANTERLPAPYGKHNWREGGSWQMYFDALQRHLWAFWEREEEDPESGHSHLAHAGANLLILLWYSITHEGDDDRPK